MIHNNNTPRQVIVGVITSTGTVSIWFCQALVESIKECLAQNIVVIPFLLLSQDSSTMGYNQLLNVAWREEVDSLILVSPDVYWQPRAMLDIILSNKDVVGLPVFGPEGFQVQLGELPRLQSDEKSGEIKVLGCGLNFLRFSKKTLQELCETHSSILFGGEEVKQILQQGDIYGTFATDAEVLAYRLKEAGFEIWLNPRHTVNTVSKQRFEGDFVSALKEAQNGAV